MLCRNTERFFYNKLILSVFLKGVTANMKKTIV